MGKRRGLGDPVGLVRGQAVIEGLIGPREADRVLVEENEPLEIDLFHADFGRNPHESG